jgi:YD repeat-containing protein
MCREPRIHSSFSAAGCSVQRVSQTDGLGRLLSVCEVTSTTLAVGITGSTTPAACSQDISATGFLTSYQYDGLNNLTKVTQGPLTARTFAYDSLSRLTSAFNPESGNASYIYDNEGNLTQRTQPAPNQTGSSTVTATMQYDPLNRVYSKMYSDTTPPVTINYDETSALSVSGLTNTTGRKSSEYTGPSSAKLSGAVFSYDTMGRVLNNSQCTPQNCGTAVFPITYAYDLLGNALTSTNGKGTTFTYSYNRAERATNLASSLSDNNHPATLFSGAHYDAYGMNLSSTLGDNNSGHIAIPETRTEVTSGNGANRGWLGSYSVGTSGSIYNLSMSSYAPDGDILAANDSVNGNWTYGHDDFNRLTSAAKTGNSYTYVYDRFSNRWQQNGPTTVLETFDANNHNNPTDGVMFDAAGNVKSYNNGMHTYNYTYDAENRLTTVDTTAGVYTYSAEAQRIRSSVSGAISDYLYDLGGRATTTVGATGNWTRGEVFLGKRHLATYVGGSSGATNFAFADWLGTVRVKEPATGGTAETCTSLPFW